MRSKHIQILLLILILSQAAFAQNNTEIVAANGQKYAVAGKDRTRGENEIVLFTADYYKQKPTAKNGVDVYVAGGKVSIIQDRAGAVYLQNKPDPGAIAVGGAGKNDFVFSANGEARRWVLANIKVGDAVTVGEVKIVKNSAGEIVPPATLPCFAGAYYRKAVSSFDTWTGIGGLVKLGTPKVDENRLDEADKQPLDNFSVYMGGNAGGRTEVDAGLTWEFTLDDAGKRSARRNAFRPFWRTRNWNSAPDQKQFYFYPGETVQMAVLVAGPNKLRLIVSDGKTKTFQTDFDAEGFAPNVPRQFKRVNAIDQRRNEGKPVQPTKAEITGAEWLQTVLLRGEGANAKQIPLDKTRFTDMRCANESNVVVTPTDQAKGAEKIDIFGTPRK